MDWLFCFAATGTLLFALFHLIGAYVFAAWLKRQEATGPTSNPQEPVAILVASRGFDPSLPQMLRGLLEQDYPHYDVHVTVDESEGPARDRLGELIADHPNRGRLQLHTLGEPRSTCGLKNSALLVGLSQLSPQTSRIAMIDTDIVPTRNWLADLTAYLDDPAVGAVSGAQWFEPDNRVDPGSLVRSLWNAAAVVPTCMFANAWAGSLAFRRHDFEQAGLPELWARTIVDDGPLPEAIRKQGLRMKFAKNMFMINRESCSLGYVNNWLTRMLCWSKLYEASFRNTLVHAVLTLSVLSSFLCGLALALGSGNALWSGLLLGSLISGNSFYVLAWSRVRRAVREASLENGPKLARPVSGKTWLALWCFVPLTQLAFCIATLRVLGLRTIRWRGAEYEITSPTEVRLISRGSVPGQASAHGKSI